MVKCLDQNERGGSSQTESTSKSTVLKQTLTIAPGTVSKNSDGTYSQAHTVKQPDGKLTTVAIGFIKDQCYTAHLKKSEKSFDWC